MVSVHRDDTVPSSLFRFRQYAIQPRLSDVPHASLLRVTFVAGMLA
jgi:hypothetical protein